MSKLVNKTKTKLIRIDAGVHKLAKMRAAQLDMSIRSLVEGSLADVLGPRIEH